MAIGDNNGSNNGYQNKNYEATYYSRFRSARVDELSLNINFRSGLLILEISKMEENIKSTPVAAIYLSPMKATMLVGEMKNLLDYRAGSKIDPNKGFGVNAGLGEKVTYIAFSTDSDKAIYCTIGKFDGNGTIVESTKYKFAVDYHYTLQWNNLDSNDLEKVYHNDAEFLSLMKAVEDFGRFMNGAAGYAGLDLNRYENGKVTRRIDSIMDKLGIERQGGRSYNGSNSGNNFLSNSSSRHTNMDELEDLID